jgi:1-acyl-sn-glycerol-3-phosphate acyltransferase
MQTWFFRPGAAVAGMLARIVGPVRVIGLERIPREGPFILVANHASDLDPPFLGWAAGYQIGRVIHFMAKVEMQRWPIFGWLADRSGVFYVRRGEGDRAAQRLALELLAAGKPIAIFPEGTRSPDGHLRPAKPGTALLAIRSGAPLVPAGIAGTQRLRPPGERLVRRHRITIRFGEPFVLERQAAGRIDRTALAAGGAEITRRIAALLPLDQRPGAEALDGDPS